MIPQKIDTMPSCTWREWKAGRFVRCCESATTELFDGGYLCAVHCRKAICDPLTILRPVRLPKSWGFHARLWKKAKAAERRINYWPLPMRKLLMYWHELGRARDAVRTEQRRLFALDLRRVQAPMYAGVMRVARANAAMMKADPNGEYPSCKPGIGTLICERCGCSNTRQATGACPAIPPEQRWSIDYTAVQP